MDVSNFLTYTEDVFLALTQQNEKHIRSVTDSLEYIIVTQVKSVDQLNKQLVIINCIQIKLNHLN